MENTSIDRLCHLKREVGYDPDRPRRPFRRRSRERFGDLHHKQHIESDYEGCHTPGPWLVEWIELPDGRTAYIIDGEKPGNWLAHNANASLIQQATELFEALEAWLEILGHVAAARGLDESDRWAYEELLRQWRDLRLRCLGADTGE